MPEGDTIHRTAATLRQALAGQTLTAIESTVPAVAGRLQLTPLVGGRVDAIEARGKHLLIHLAPPAGGEPLVLHTHMRMTGSWHLYRPGEPWRKPARRARVVLQTEAFVAVCFNAPVVALLEAAQLRRHPELARLGPDAAAEGFDLDAAVARLRSRPEREIAVALLDQSALAGVGNVYKSEVLFLAGISPFRPVRTLSDGELRALVERCHRLLRLNCAQPIRRTHFALNERERLWVYGRQGKPCRRCGTPIRRRLQGEEARSTYYCPRCQGVE